MIKAIVFDFDGVLVDSEAVHYQALGRAIEVLGVKLSYEEYLQKYLGYDDRQVMRLILEEWKGSAGKGEGELNGEEKPGGGQDVAHSSFQRAVWHPKGEDAGAIPGELPGVEELCRVKSRFFKELVREGVPTVAGVREFVAQVHGELPMAVASGSMRHEIEEVLGKLGMREFFALIVSADDVKRSKPDPATYRLAVAKLAEAFAERGIEAGDCLAIEDTTAGIASARGAGLLTLGLTTTTPAARLGRAHRLAGDFRGISLAKLREWYG
ncbi:MAG: HAD family phosphatase [Phycisphaeraceae bacterium]|nr:HAD family phosphatase [Phycisphaeraceae bacterium]